MDDVLQVVQKGSGFQNTHPSVEKRNATPFSTSHPTESAGLLDVVLQNERSAVTERLGTSEEQSVGVCSDTF